MERGRQALTGEGPDASQLSAQIDGGKTFRDFIRVNKDSQRLIKKLIAQVSGVAVPIGPYEPRTAAKHTSNAEQSLHALEKLGLDVSIEDSAKKSPLRR